MNVTRSVAWLGFGGWYVAVRLAVIVVAPAATRVTVKVCVVEPDGIVTKPAAVTVPAAVLLDDRLTLTFEACAAAIVTVSVTLAFDVGLVGVRDIVGLLTVTIPDVLESPPVTL